MKAFFAYPSSLPEVCQAIRAAKKELETSHRQLVIQLWEENDISGRPLTDPIFKGIAQADFLIADVTAINFNVTFEIAYAIGLRKRVFLTRNGNFRRDGSLSDRIGIFDTLGFVTYQDQAALCALVRGFQPENTLTIRGQLNTKTPVYILNTPQSNLAMLAIMARIKKARLGFSGYIPVDDPRLSAIKAIDDVAASLGVIVPLLAASFADAEVHNIRAAFVGGLATAMNKAVLLLQPSDGPAPLDVRDMVKTFNKVDDIAPLIATFALDVTERLQADDPIPLPRGNFLAELTIGDAVAENEFQTLGNYYIRTDQYKRASRGEVNLVVGRKGAGKTALFSQLRNEKRNNVVNIVVDLKPESYQLIRLKEDVLDYLAEGARDHLVVALFEYVLYLEVAYKVLEKDQQRHARDIRLYEPYLKLQALYEATNRASEGDFSERLLDLSRELVDAFKARYGQQQNQRLSSTQVTELIHKDKIKGIREALSEYLEFKESVWVLFDNLDKGWSSHGLAAEDIMILRCLIAAARKIQHEMQRDEHDFNCLVFVRNDVYQNLVEANSDYGKESRAVLDWTDPDRLRELIRLRLIYNSLDANTTFEKIWSKICISHYKGEESSQYLIDRSLMRPRNLIKLFAHCRGFAVGLGKSKIDEADFDKGLRAYSLDLITEADQELTDILGRGTNLIYHFVGEGNEFSKEGLENLITWADVPVDKVEAVINFMLYYGFLGIRITEATVKYIFDVNYDMKLMNVLVVKARENLTFVLSPAFHAGLNL